MSRSSLYRLRSLGRVAFVALVVSLVLPAFAQTGTIQGQIIGRDGKGLEGVAIAIDRIDIPQHFETRSGGSGRFSHVGLPTGRYELSVVYDGQTARLNARVQFGGISNVDIDLRRLMPYDPKQRYRTTLSGLTVPRKAQEEWKKATNSKDDLEAAEKHLAKAIEIAPNFEEALNDLGTIYHRKKRFAEAATLFERALKVNPQSVTARVNLGWTLLYLKQYEKALNENLRVLETLPDDAQAHAQAGLALFNLRKYESSIPHFVQAKRSDRNSPLMPGYFLASAYDISGNAAAAIAEYEEFLKTHPYYSDRAEIEKRILALKH
jgi:tetratricopeptide (TPR) repeat protein